MKKFKNASDSKKNPGDDGDDSMLTELLCLINSSKEIQITRISN